MLVSVMCIITTFVSHSLSVSSIASFFFCNDTATPEISPLPPPAPLPICAHEVPAGVDPRAAPNPVCFLLDAKRPHGVEVHGDPGHRRRVVVGRVGDDQGRLGGDRHT